MDRYAALIHSDTFLPGIKQVEHGRYNLRLKAVFDRLRGSVPVRINS